MSQFYKQEAIHCGSCNEHSARIETEPEVFIVYIKCKKDHNIKIKLNRKTGKIETLTEDNG